MVWSRVWQKARDRRIPPEGPGCVSAAAWPEFCPQMHLPDYAENTSLEPVTIWIFALHNSIFVLPHCLHS
jgi:hypothetical protein